MLFRSKESPTGTIQLVSDASFEFLAVAEEGYEFAGWTNALGETICESTYFNHVGTKDEKLVANFIDVVDPYGTIELIDKAGLNMSEMDSTGLVQYSTEGYVIAIQSGDDHSGVDTIEYQIVKEGETFDDQNNWITYESFPQPEITQDMHAIVYVRVTDRFQNSIVFSSDPFVVDAKGISIEMSPNFTESVFMNDKNAMISVKVTENLAGMTDLVYTVNKKEYKPEDTEFVITDLPDGEYVVEVKATDRAGHTMCSQVEVKKDTAQPTIAVTGNPTEMARSITLQLATSGGISKVKNVTVNGVKVEGDSYPVKSNGIYTFVITNYAGSTTTQIVEVRNLVTEVASLTSTESRVIEVGKSVKMGYTLLPVDATYQNVTFVSSNPKVASISQDGVLIANKIGTTKITIQSADNPSVNCVVNVKVVLPKAKSVKVKRRSAKQRIVTWRGTYQAKKYAVYRATSLDGKYKLVATVRSSVYIDKDVKKNKKYYYKIVNIAKKVEYSSFISASSVTKSKTNTEENTNESSSSVKKLTRCSNVKVKSNKSNITLQWNGVKSATHYKVYRAESEYGAYEEIALVEGKNKYKDRRVENGKTYFYRVAAVKMNEDIVSGLSTWSKYVMIKKTK